MVVALAWSVAHFSLPIPSLSTKLPDVRITTVRKDSFSGANLIVVHECFEVAEERSHGILLGIKA